MPEPAASCSPCACLVSLNAAEFLGYSRRKRRLAFEVWVKQTKRVTSWMISAVPSCASAWQGCNACKPSGTVPCCVDVRNLFCVHRRLLHPDFQAPVSGSHPGVRLPSRIRSAEGIPAVFGAWRRRFGKVPSWASALASSRRSAARPSWARPVAGAGGWVWFGTAMQLYRRDGSLAGPWSVRAIHLQRSPMWKCSKKSSELWVGLDSGVLGRAVVF